MGRGRRGRRKGNKSSPGFVRKETHVLCPACFQDYLTAYMTVLVETYYKITYTPGSGVRVGHSNLDGTHEQEYILGCGSCDFAYAFDSKASVEEEVQDYIDQNNMLVEAEVPEPGPKEKKIEPLRMLLKKSGVIGDDCSS